MLKKIVALLAALMLCLSMVSFAAAEDVPNLAGTYYSYGYDVGFFIDYFFHFYDEVPGVGKVFYAGFALNQITYNGTYDVIAEERDYACWPDRETVAAAAEGAEIPAGKAPYTVVFYDFDGKELDRCGLDAEGRLYVDMKTIAGIGGENAIYILDTDPENSKFAADYKNEQALSILELVNPEDDTATLTLKVNGKYDDLIVMYVEGTYAMNEDQTVITLTPDSESDEGATVTKKEDGSWTYVSKSGEEVALTKVVGLEMSYALKGEIPVPGMEGTNADFICALYNDGSARLYADFMGNQMDVDKGTYEIDMTTYSFNIHFEGAGDITTEGFGADMVLNYKREGVELFGDIEQTLKFVTE